MEAFIIGISSGKAFVRSVRITAYFLGTRFRNFLRQQMAKMQMRIMRRLTTLTVVMSIERATEKQATIASIHSKLQTSLGVQLCISYKHYF